MIRASSNEATAAVNTASVSLDKLKSSLNTLGTQMTTMFTVPIVAAGAAGIKLAMDLDKSMRNIQSITKQTDESLGALSDTFVEMSTDMTKTTDTAQNLANAFYDIVGSGFEGADAMKVLEVATKAASAGLTTTQNSVKGITAVLNAYNLKADDAAHVSDLLFETVNRGVGTFEELNASLSNVIPTSAAMNISLEEVMAAMATMSKQGFSFAESSVALNQAMTALISPSEAMSKAISELGYSSGQAMVDALGFSGAMQALAEHTGGSQEQMAALFGNVRAMRAAFALTGDAANMFSEDLIAMAQASGATEAAFAEQMKSFDAVWKNFQNTLNAALIEIGQALLPLLTQFLQTAVIPLVQWFRSLDDTTKAWIIGIAGVIATVGPLLLLIGQLIGAFQAIATIAPILAGGISAIGGAFALLFTPLGLFVAFVAIAVAAILGNWFGLRDALVNSVGAIVNAVSQVGDAFKGAGNMVAQGWENIYHQVGTTLAQIAQIVGITLGRLAVIGLTIGKEIIGGLIKGFSHAMIQFIALVQEKVAEVNQAIKNAFGIASPSKVMMEVGQNIVAGLHKGIENFGGIGVDVPSVSGSRSMPSLAMQGASNGGNGNGGGNTTWNIYPPMGTSAEQIDYIAREIDKRQGKEIARRGGKPIK